MRHGKQTAAFFLAAAMVMSSSPAVVFGEELESGAEQEVTEREASTESELTSGEQETIEQTGDAVLPEDNLLSADSEQEKPEEGLPQDNLRLDANNYEYTGLLFSSSYTGELHPTVKP